MAYGATISKLSPASCAGIYKSLITITGIFSDVLDAYRVWVQVITSNAAIKNLDLFIVYRDIIAANPPPGAIFILVDPEARIVDDILL